MVQIREDLSDSVGESVIQCESFSGIVQGKTGSGPLFADGGSIFFLPVPGSLQEAFSTQIIAGDAFFS